jgi:hypothetical protein
VCPDCLKEKKIVIKGVCRNCYYRAYKKKKPPKITCWWKSVEIEPVDKEQIRLCLLRFKWSYETSLDVMTLMHFYLKYKSEKMPLFEPFTVEYTMNKVKKQMSKIFK